MKTCTLCNSKKYKKLFVVNGKQIVECTKCGLVRTNSKKFASYEEYHRDEKEYSKEEELFRNIFQKRYNNISKFKNSPGKILDIGASTGTLLQIFKDKGWEVWGVEPSKSAGVAKKRGIKILNQDFEASKLPKNYFDVVVMNHTFEHVMDPLKVLRKIKSVLTKGGLVYIDVPNFGGSDSKFKGEHWGYLMPEEHTYHFTKDTLSALFAKAGFEVLWIKTWSGIFDVGNPVKKLWYEGSRFRKSFIKDMVKIPFNIITTATNKGSSLAAVGKKS